jgi:hypothetical protein
MALEGFDRRKSLSFEEFKSDEFLVYGRWDTV